MNWDALGAIAELAGAIAVFVTLIYLAIQLRQNTRAVEAEFGRSNMELGTTWIYGLVRDPSVAKLYLEGLDDQLNTREEKLRFHLLMQALFNQWALMYATNGAVTDADVAHVISSPGGRAYLQRARERDLHGASPRGKAFMEYVTRLEQTLAKNV